MKPLTMGAPAGNELLRVSDDWKSAHREAHVGVLAMRGLANPPHSPALENEKAHLESSLRQRFEGADRATLRGHPVLAAYDAYYRRFGKTYHVQLQLESVVLKGKSLPVSAALVEAMFMAELNGLLLTAGHDLDAIQQPIMLDVAHGTESYTLLRGDTQSPKSGDMMIVDQAGIISSIVYGPDQRTQIRPDTTRALFTIYAPPGISKDQITTQLREIAANARLISPAAEVEVEKVYSGG